MLTPKQLEKIKEEIAEIHSGLATIIEEARGHAREVRGYGRRIDKIHEKIADVKQFPEKVTREEFNALLKDIKALNSTAQQLKKRRSD